MVRSRLERKMNVLGDFRQISQCLDKVVAKSDWVRGGKAKPLQTVDLVHRFEQLDEGAFAIHLRDFVPPEQVHYLAEECHFLDVVRDELAHLTHDFFDRATSFRAACPWHNAKGAMHVAALHDGNESRRLL